MGAALARQAVNLVARRWANLSHDLWKPADEHYGDNDLPALWNASLLRLTPIVGANPWAAAEPSSLFGPHCLTYCES
jgi:hypothetical protein